VHILNRTAKSPEKDNTLYEMLLGKKPRMKHHLVSDLVRSGHIPDSRRRKMDKNAAKCYLIGNDGEESYRMYIHEQHKIILSRYILSREIKALREECVELPMSDVKTLSPESESDLK